MAIIKKKIAISVPGKGKSFFNYPLPSSYSISKVMKSNKAKGTRPEIVVTRFLRENSYKGYRLNWDKVPGKPDIVFPAKKIAIFINGCFWHSCPYCKIPFPKNNGPYWKAKLSANKLRDKIYRNVLVNMGWRVVVIWECQITNGPAKVMNRIHRVMSKSGALIK